MRVGEEAKVNCPANIAYGSHAQGSIPPNSTLMFDM